MHQNFIIIEFWDKKISGPADKLIGIVKIPLEQFYISFKDKQISRVLLRAQFPVISTDSWLHIIDPFTSTNKSNGEIQVLLAMGTTDQITAVQVAHAGGDLSSLSNNKKPTTISNNDQSSSLIEHHFELMIESINGLRAFESMVWGESDCFIQYLFPIQQEQEQQQQLTNANSIKPFQFRTMRTAATLCTSDPTFHDSSKFRYLLSPADALHKYFYAGKKPNNQVIKFFSFSLSLSSTICN
jgi:C2 domain-containing protein 3